VKAAASVEAFQANSEQQDAWFGMFSLGYAEGLTEGIRAADIQRPERPSKEITNQRVVRIIGEHIAGHPEKAHEVTAILALEAQARARIHRKDCRHNKRLRLAAFVSRFEHTGMPGFILSVCITEPPFAGRAVHCCRIITPLMAG
jgi:hypothetical protein